MSQEKVIINIKDSIDILEEYDDYSGYYKQLVHKLEDFIKNFNKSNSSYDNLLELERIIYYTNEEYVDEKNDAIEKIEKILIDTRVLILCSIVIPSLA